MPRKWVALLLAALFLLSGLPAQAASPALPTPGPTKWEITYPKEITAGDLITVEVGGLPFLPAGACCGYLLLAGPSDQYVQIHLERAAADRLVGRWQSSPHSEPGTWQFWYGYTESMNGEYRSIEWEDGPALTVRPGTRSVDIYSPTIFGYGFPEAADVGDWYEITVEAYDALSGIDFAFATVAPAMENPPWTMDVALLPTEVEGEFAGRMLMDPPMAGSVGNRIIALWVSDRAGNVTYFDQADFAEIATTTRARWRGTTTPLATDQHLDLIHPGRQTFAEWLGRDQVHLLKLTDQLALDRAVTEWQRVDMAQRTDLTYQIMSNRAVVMEQLLAELSQLQTALDRLQTEVYTDPKTGLKLVPVVTTGKGLVLNRAMALRISILQELQPALPPIVSPVRLEMFRKEISEHYGFTWGDERPLALDAESIRRYNEEALAVLHAVKESPTLVASLLNPPKGWYGPDELHLGHIYFSPVKSQRLSTPSSGGNEHYIPMVRTRPLVEVISELYVRAGLHFGQTYIADMEEPGRDERWLPYVTMRGGHGWVEKQARNSPLTNFIHDFILTYRPFARLDPPMRSYPALTANSQAEGAFRQFVDSLQKGGVPTFQPTLRKRFQLGTAEQFTLGVTAPDLAVSLTTVYRSTSSQELDQKVAGEQSENVIRFKAEPQPLGTFSTHLLQATDQQGRERYRWFYVYFALPMLIDPLPAGTDQASITITGSTLPGQVVTAGAVSATADGEGRFRLELPLQPGENQVRITRAGIDLGVRLTIHRSVQP